MHICPLDHFNARKDTFRLIKRYVDEHVGATAFVDGDFNAPTSDEYYHRLPAQFPSNQQQEIGRALDDILDMMELFQPEYTHMPLSGSKKSQGLAE